MKKHRTGRVSLPTLTATLALAITFTFTACEEKKKQDGANTTASESAAAPPSKEEAAREAYIKENGGTFTDSRDKKTYKTIKIGEQVWMAENLNLESGDCYEGEAGNCYGRLYNLETAMKACPSGWHLPNNAEWDKLLYYVDNGNGISPYNSKTAGKHLKAKSGWNENGNGTDKYGFSALPGGCYINEGGFTGFGTDGYWWSRSENNGEGAYIRSMKYNEEGASYSDDGYKYDQYSIRCVQDDANYAKIAKAEAEEKAAAKAKAEAKLKAEREAYVKANDGTFTDTRDKKTYKTIKIGEQTWMAENLNIETGKSVCYDNNPDNCKKYGRLYDWETAKKACPIGWHLPSEAELDKLISKSASDGKDLRAYSGGKDNYGFSALPGSGDNGNWWSSSENGSITDLGYGYEGAGLSGFDKNGLASVRCLKD